MLRQLLRRLAPPRRFQSDPRRAAREKVTWTIGLFCIFLLVPIFFLVPRILEQVKIETFDQYYWRGSRIEGAASRNLASRLKKAERFFSDAAGTCPDALFPPPALPGLLAASVQRDQAPLQVCYAPLLAPAERAAVLHSLESFAASRDAEEKLESWRAAELDAANLFFSRRTGDQTSGAVIGLVVNGRSFFRELLETEYQRSLLGLVAPMRVYLRGAPYLEFESYPGAWRWLLPGGYTSAPKKVWLRSMLSREQRLLLYAGRFPEPLRNFELVFAADRVPYGPREVLVGIDLSILFLALLIGAFAISRLWRGQIELTEKQENFVSAVTHELKSPLTSIRMYSDMLCQGWVKDREKISGYHHYILTESERLSRLIENVLQLSGLAHGNGKLNLAKHSLPELAERISAKVRAQAAAAGFELEAPRPETPVSVNTDEDALAQIAVNLVDNAVKFSKEASLKKIILTFSSLPDGFSLSVRDFGPGVNPAQMEKIFDLFYRPESELTRKTSGTGIGLALVDMLAQKLGGRVSVANAGPGAVFTVTLPARPDLARPRPPVV